MKCEIPNLILLCDLTNFVLMHNSMHKFNEYDIGRLKLINIGILIIYNTQTFLLLIEFH